MESMPATGERISTSVRRGHRGPAILTTAACEADCPGEPDAQLQEALGPGTRNLVVSPKNTYGISAGQTVDVRGPKTPL
jgi:hypothetical protein